MKTAVVQLESVSAYSQSKHFEVPKLDKESDADFEKRNWRERMHVDENGHVCIPPMSFKNCLTESAKFLGEKIKGKGQSTWTKHFLAGVLVSEPLILPLKKMDVKGEWLFVPSDGVTGSGKHVSKCFPVIPHWAGTVTFYIMDETITQEAFKHHLEEAGKFIGLGRFRPRNGGYYGRFQVKSIKWN